MRWAVAFHPQQVQAMPDGRFKFLNEPMQIAEHCIAAAVAQGWIVLGSDSDVLSEPIPARTMDMRLLSDGQSNPHRESHGYGVARDCDEGDER